jgi:hypothetical protein
MGRRAEKDASTGIWARKSVHLVGAIVWTQRSIIWDEVPSVVRVLS